MMPDALPFCDFHRMVRTPIEAKIISVEDFIARPEPLQIATVQCKGFETPRLRVLEPQKPIPIQRITLCLAEGPSHRVGKEIAILPDGKHSTSIRASTEFMVIAGAINIKDGDGYKAEYAITWEDGSSYEGKYLLGSGGRENGNTFHENFMRRIFWMAGLRNDAALNRSEATLQAVAIYGEKGVQYARNLLSSHEL